MARGRVSLAGKVQSPPDPLSGLFPLLGDTLGEHAARLLGLTNSRVSLLSDSGS